MIARGLSFEEAEKLALSDTMHKLRRHRKPPSWYKRLFAGKFRRKPAKLTRRAAFEQHQQWRADRARRREHGADTPFDVPYSPAVQTQHDSFFYAIESKAQAELKHLRTRVLVADKLTRVANGDAAADDSELQTDLLRQAKKLRDARKIGHWGVNLDTGAQVVRFLDRSGLQLLDPSEARQRQAVILGRLLPELMRLHAAGMLLYYVVFTEPNVPAGSLAWEKKNIFARFRRVILGRLPDGTVPSTCFFPEIIGTFVVEEDPLAADLHTWNVHLNAILVVDPSLAAPLPAELMKQGEINLSGPLAKLPAPVMRDLTPPGLLSFAKLHFAWAGHQLKAHKLEPTRGRPLAKTLLEVLKYATKLVSNSELEAIAAGSAACAPLKQDRTGLVAECSEPGRTLSSGATPPFDGGARPDSVPPALGAVHGSLFSENPVARARRAAPAFTEWPDERVIEWLKANRRFRRVRGSGLLYRLPKQERPPDPDEAGRIRWLGRVWITVRGVHVQASRLSFHVRELQRSSVNLIQGDKSGCDFPDFGVRTPGSRAREGPAHA